GEPRGAVSRTGLELIEVVVGGDVLPRVGSLGGAERALLRHELPPVRRGPLTAEQRPGREDAGPGNDRSPRRGANELAAVQVDFFVGDLRARNVRRTFNQHNESLQS